MKRYSACDHAGCHQPGTGTLPLSTSLDWLIANGYGGFVGLEFKPVGETAAALAETVRILGR